MSASIDLRPAWLKRAVSDNKYRRYVWQTLYDRDKVRRKARDSGGGDADDLALFYQASEAKSRKNMKYNLFADILPYDMSRVLIGEVGGKEDPYINASWVRERFGGQWWIATQQPSKLTVDTFIALFVPGNTSRRVKDQIVVSHTPRIIVQLDNEPAEYLLPVRADESGINTGNGRFLEFKTDDEPKFMEEENCVKRTLRVVQREQEDTKDLGKVTHLEFKGWPDYCVPENKRVLLAFARLVIEEQLSLNPSDTSSCLHRPTVVHCKAGVGRAGTLISTCSVLRKHGLLREGAILGSLKPWRNRPPSPLGPLPQNLQNNEVAMEVDSLRDQRYGMVQGESQHEIIYKVLEEALLEEEERLCWEALKEEEEARWRNVVNRERQRGLHRQSSRQMRSSDSSHRIDPRECLIYEVVPSRKPIQSERDSVYSRHEHTGPRHKQGSTHRSIHRARRDSIK